MLYQVYQLDETRVKFRNEHGNVVDGISGNLRVLSGIIEAPDPITALLEAKAVGHKNPIIGEAK